MSQIPYLLITPQHHNLAIHTGEELAVQLLRLAALRSSAIIVRCRVLMTYLSKILQPTDRQLHQSLIILDFLGILMEPHMKQPSIVYLSTMLAVLRSMGLVLIHTIFSLVIQTAIF